MVTISRIGGCTQTDQPQPASTRCYCEPPLDGLRFGQGGIGFPSGALGLLGLVPRSEAT